MLTAIPGVERAPSPAPSPSAGDVVWRANALVAADSLAVFRILFGLLVSFGSFRFLGRGWVDALYLEPANHLTYPGFGWIRPLASPWMHLLMIGLGVTGMAIAAGYRHRLSTGLFIIGFVYTELIEASLYLNHYWFVTLAAMLLWMLPVHHRWSLDARAGRVDPRTHVANWVVWAIRAQLGVVYMFAGIAKINPDWLLEAQPLQLWLTDRADLALIGPLLQEPGVAHIAAWSAALFDCTIVGWLLWRRTRPMAYATLIVFHLGTAALFQIGLFPWIMIASTLIFFPPDWPQQLAARSGMAGMNLGFVAKANEPNRPTDPVGSQPFLLIALMLFALLQVALPLRHYFADGNVRWNEDGYYLSWRVMLTEKAGHVDYTITDPAAASSWEVGPELVLTDWQTSHAATRPDLIHNTALLLADHYQTTQGIDVEIRANSWVSMNGRPAARLLDPTVDLRAHARGGLPRGTVLEP